MVLLKSHHKMSSNVYYNLVDYGSIIEENIKNISWRYHDVRHNQYNLSALMFGYA